MSILLVTLLSQSLLLYFSMLLLLLLLLLVVHVLRFVVIYFLYFQSTSFSDSPSYTKKGKMFKMFTNLRPVLCYSHHLFVTLLSAPFFPYALLPSAKKLINCHLSIYFVHHIDFISLLNHDNPLSRSPPPHHLHHYRLYHHLK